MADRKVELRVEVPTAGIERAGQAFRGLGDVLKDNTSIAERFKDLTGKSFVDTATLADRLGDKMRLAFKADGIKSARAEIEGLGKALATMDAKLDPANLRKRVALEMELVASQKQLNKAMAEERARQGGGAPAGAGGVVQQLLGSMGGRMGGLASSVGGLFGGGAAGLAGGGGAMLAVAGPVGAIAAVAMQAASAIKQLGIEVLNLAGAANAASKQRFDRAMADMHAVVGRFLVPVLDLATDGVRAFADVLANIMPSSATLRSALRPLKGAFDEIKDALMPLAPLFKTALIDGLRAAGFVIKVFADQLKAVSYVVNLGTRAFPGLQGQTPTTSVGAAPTQASWVGVEDIGRKAAEAAFATGWGDGGEVKKTPTELLLGRVVEFLHGPLAQALSVVAKPAELAVAAPAVANAVAGDPFGVLRGIMKR